MSEETPNEQQPQEGGNSGYTPPASQEELNQIITQRIDRERAKFGDYDDLKAKAARLSEIEESNKSEIEKAQERAAEAQAEVERVPQKVAAELRGHLIALHEINDDDAELFLTASEPELLLKQAQRLVERGSDRKMRGNYVAGEGSTSKPKDDEMTRFTRQLFESANP